MEEIEKREEEYRESLKIDIKKISGIQFDPEDWKITRGAIDELNYIRGLVSHLRPHEDADANETADFGTSLVFNWIDDRLNALGNHIENVLRCSSLSPSRDLTTPDPWAGCRSRD